MELQLKQLKYKMISKLIEIPITKIYFNKLRLHYWVYEWAYDGGIIRNDGPTMIYLIFK